MAMLYVNIFFIVVDVNKDWVFLSTFFYCYGPICAGITRDVAEAIEVAPSGIANVWKRMCYLLIIEITHIFASMLNDFCIFSF